MTLFKIGDRVEVLHENLTGVVTSIAGSTIWIEDQDGFPRTFKPDELVLTPDKAAYDAALDDLTLKSDDDSRSMHSDDDSSDYIDLHIEELTDDHRGMTNTEILSLQLRYCRRFLLKSVESRKKKVVIIHGKGEGVLRSAVHGLLVDFSLENDIRIQTSDAAKSWNASQGATEVTFFYSN